MARPDTRDRRYRPIDLACAAGISTQQVRNDEAAGVLPPVERTTNGYRRYQEEHLRALLVYRALARAHNAPIARQIMRAVHAQDVAAALELLDVSHGQLQQQRLSLRATRAALVDVAADPISDVRREDDMLIGEVAGALGVRASTLRFWDAAGLIRPARTVPHRYRTYSPVDVRDARIVQQLRLSRYRLDQVRQVLTALRRAGDTGALHAAIDRRQDAIARQAQLMLGASAALSGYLHRAASNDPG